MGFVGLCLLVGAVDGSVTARAGHLWYARLRMPAGLPPHWAFAPVWAALCGMVGTAGWLVWKRLGAARPLRLWGWQLAANALWAPAFFGLHSPELALVVLILLMALIAMTIYAFRQANRLAAWLMLPYAAWCVYAAYLNTAFVLLNHH